MRVVITECPAPNAITEIMIAFAKGLVESGRDFDTLKLRMERKHAELTRSYQNLNLNKLKMDFKKDPKGQIDEATIQYGTADLAHCKIEFQYHES